ncbi:MAG TPA: hypothetical protein VJR87_06560 [Allosphingosinicella sp.]|nr:hypothetical protein [Allosphingosinicella sp.]
MAAMLIVVIVLVSAGLVALLFAIVGRRSRTIFTNPGALPDRQIEATINLTRRIMQRARTGSPAWTRAAAAHKAAVDEQLRRRGEQPFDNIELTGPQGG